MSDITEADEGSVVLMPENIGGEQPSELPPEGAVNTGLVIPQETASAQMGGLLCKVCRHAINPDRRGSPRCTNNCMCSSGGCTTMIMDRVDAPVEEEQESGTPAPAE